MVLDGKGKYTVNILMSTYNGANYICEQLDSLYEQRGVVINLFVRDDGSTDNTIELIEHYRNKFHSVQIYKENNIGATKSYYALSMKVLLEDSQCEYYAFCDQDDIWKKDKLIKGIQKLEYMNGRKPLLYYSNLMILDEKGNEKGLLINRNSKSTSKKNGLASIGAYGCTCIFNKHALEKFCDIRSCSEHIYHDNWLYAVCTFLGEIYYDDESCILYRQTGLNVSGKKNQGIWIWGQRIQKLLNLSIERNLYEDIASELIFCFKDDLDQKDIKFLELFLKYRHDKWCMICLLFSRRMKVKSISKNICIMGRTLLKKL